MTADDRLRLALEAANRGDCERCSELLRPIEQEIDQILTALAKTTVDIIQAPRH